MKLAPIALFVYNRPEHTHKVLEYLSRNLLASESEIYIFSDAAKNPIDFDKVDSVRKIAQSYNKKFLKVHYFFSSKSKGMYASLVDGMNFIFQQHNAVIFLEDDIITSPKFLFFLNDCLQKFKDYKNVFTVSAYNYPRKELSIINKGNESIFLTQRFTAWGFAIWKDRWEKVYWNIDYLEKYLSDKKFLKKYKKTGIDKVRMLRNHVYKKNMSFGITLDFYMFINETFSIHPFHSFTKNIGHDNTGQNCKNVNEKFFNDTSLNNDYMLSNTPIHSDLIDLKFRSYVRKLYFMHLFLHYFNKCKCLFYFLNYKNYF